MIDRNFNRSIVGGSFIGAVAGGIWLQDEFKPRIGDTVFRATAGAVAGGITGVIGPVILPVAFPIIAFIGPIHLYNKYRWEKSVKNLK